MTDPDLTLASLNGTSSVLSVLLQHSRCEVESRRKELHHKGGGWARLSGTPRKASAAPIRRPRAPNERQTEGTPKRPPAPATAKPPRRAKKTAHAHEANRRRGAHSQHITPLHPSRRTRMVVHKGRQTAKHCPGIFSASRGIDALLMLAAAASICDPSRAATAVATWDRTRNAAGPNLPLRFGNKRQECEPDLFARGLCVHMGSLEVLVT